MKNRKGSTLILVLIIFVFLSILATATMSFMVSENKQSVYQKNKIEAYYIARSGAEATEAAIMKMTSKEVKDLNYELIIRNHNNTNDLEVSFEGFEIRVNPEVFLKKDDEGFITIKSTGTVGKSSEILVKVIEIDNSVSEPDSNPDSESNPDTNPKLEFEYPIYAHGNLKIYQDIYNNVIINPEMPLAYLGEFKGNKNKIPGGVYKASKEEIEPHIPLTLEINKNSTINIAKTTSEAYKTNIFGNEYDGFIITQEEAKDKNFEDKKNYYIDGNVEINVGSAKTINSNIYATGNVKIRTTSGAIYVKSNIIANGEVDINGHGEVSIEKDIISNGNITIKSIGLNTNIKGNIKSNGEIDINSWYGTIIEKDLVAHGSIKIIANSLDTHIKGNIKSNNNIILSAPYNVIVDGDVTSSDGTITVTSRNIKGSIKGNINATGNIKLVAGSEINIEKEILSNGNIEITAAGPIFVLKGNISANGNVKLSAFDDMNIRGSIYNPESNINIASRSFRMKEGVIIGKNIDIESTITLEIIDFKNAELPISPKLDSPNEPIINPKPESPDDSTGKPKPNKYKSYYK